MLMPLADKQIMYYSNLIDAEKEYERDEDGNIIYMEIDGEFVPIPKGTVDPHYGDPKKFNASISGELNEMHVKSWGVDASSIYYEIVCQKNELKDIKVGSVIWKDNEILWENEEEKIPKEASADYTVAGLNRADKHVDWYLLRANNIEG